jgi:hypothetical protein
MKKIILSAFSVLAIASIVFISCKSKNDADAIAPKYKEEGGTGGNPNITNVTTTGTVSTTSGAFQDSQMTNIGVGGSWSSVGCSNPAPSCITVNNSSLGTGVTVCFSASPSAGSYQLVSSSTQLGPGKAFLTVTNPTGQPSGTTWYSAGGSVNVTINAPSITVSFNSVACLQSGTNFPVVTVTGQVGCL